MTVAVIDIETTGLDPSRHEIWELALIVYGHRDSSLDGEWWWQMRPDLGAADPLAMRKGRYYERNQVGWRPVMRLASPWGDAPGSTSRDRVAELAARMLDDATVYGAVPSFDLVEFLGPWLRSRGQCPTWNHRIRCVETLTAGHLGREVGGLRDCADALGVPYEPADLHTGLGDARLADAIRRRILEPDEGAGGVAGVAVHYGGGGVVS